MLPATIRENRKHSTYGLRGACHSAGAMTRSPSAVPFKPDWSARPKPSETFLRTCAARVKNWGAHEPAETTLGRMFPEESGLLLKAVTAPATMSDAGWAGLLSSGATKSFLSTLGPVSAASALFKTGVVTSFDPGATFAPVILPSASGVGWVAEGDEIPVYARSISAGLTLTPKKLGALSVYSTELSKRSDIEDTLRRTLTKDVGLALDATVFSAAAATAAAPAGLLQGVTPLTATAGGGESAMKADLIRLIAAVAPVAGSAITFIAGPEQVAAIRFALPAPFDYPLLASSALSDSIVAVASDAVVAAVGEQPEIDVSNSAVLHMSDAPGPFTTGAGAVSSPSVSMFQSANISIRLLFTASFGLRAPGSLAVVNAVTW